MYAAGDRETVEKAVRLPQHKASTWAADLTWAANIWAMLTVEDAIGSAAPAQSPLHLQGGNRRPVSQRGGGKSTHKSATEPILIVRPAGHSPQSTPASQNADADTIL